MIWEGVLYEVWEREGIESMEGGILLKVGRRVLEGYLSWRYEPCSWCLVAGSMDGRLS